MVRWVLRDNGSAIVVDGNGRAVVKLGRGRMRRKMKKMEEEEAMRYERKLGIFLLREKWGMVFAYIFA